MLNPLVATSCVAISESRYLLNVFIACSAFWLHNVITSRALMCQVSVHYTLCFWDVLHNYTHFYMAEIVNIRYTCYKSSLVCIRRANLILQAYSREYRESLQLWNIIEQSSTAIHYKQIHMSPSGTAIMLTELQKATEETSSCFNHIISV
jgi:hypothetical protein